MGRTLDTVKESLAKAYLSWQSRPALVYRRLAREDIRPVSRELEAGRVTVAAVQMNLRLVASAEDYAAEVCRLTRTAAGEGAQLVVFPEDAATHLLGLLPAIRRLEGASSVDEAMDEIGSRVAVSDLFRFLGPAMRRVYYATFSYLARAFRIYIIAGSAVLPGPDGAVYNQAFFFGPDGSLLGCQRKLHLLPLEERWGLTAGKDLLTFDPPWGRTGIAVCMDATYFETFRILSLLGAEVVAVPVANPEPYNEWKALRGIWPRVQESGVYGIQSCLVGEFLGLKLTGRSGVFAPLELTPQGDGVLAQAADPYRETVVCTELDLEQLREFRASRHAEGGLNERLYEKYFPGAYQAYRTCRSGGKPHARVQAGHD